jgi:hypothetical protein
MKLQKIRPVPSASDRLFHAAAVPVAAWTSSDDRAAAALRAAAAFDARRAAIRAAARAARQSYRKTRDQAFSMEQGKMFLSFSPPRFKVSKTGKSQEQKMAISFLKCAAGEYTFKIVPNTDPASVLRFAQIVKERCGETAAAEMETAAAEILKPREEKPRNYITPGIWQNSSGQHSRRGFWTPSRIYTAGYPLDHRRPE